MKEVKVVINSKTFGKDDKQTIELIEEADVKKIIQRSLGSICKELGEHDEKLSNLISQISTSQRDISDRKEEIATLGKNINETSNMFTNLTHDLNNKIESNRSDFSAKIESLKKDAVAIQNMQRKMEEQYKTTSAIAQFFCNFFKIELEMRKDEFQQISKDLEVLNSHLPQTKHINDE